MKPDRCTDDRYRRRPLAAGDSEHSCAQNIDHTMRHQQRIWWIGDQHRQRRPSNRPGATVMMHRPVRRGSRRAGSVSQVSCPAPRSGAPTHEHVGAVIQGPLLPSSKSALRSDGPSGPATALRNRVSLASASFSLRSRKLGIWALTRPGSLLRRWTRLSDCLYPSPCQSDPSCDRSIPHTGAS